MNILFFVNFCLYGSRFELGHASHDSSCDMNSYLTPTQRKDQQIKELKSQVKVMGKQLEDKERDIESLKSQLGQEAAKAFDQRTEQIQKVRDETIALQLKNEQLANDYTESQKMIKQLQIDIEELKVKFISKQFFWKNYLFLF